MDETTGEPKGVTQTDDALLDVTQIPLLSLSAREDRVLDSVIRRLIEDVVDRRDVTASFGNAP